MKMSFSLNSMISQCMAFVLAKFQVFQVSALNNQYIADAGSEQRGVGSVEGLPTKF